MCSIDKNIVILLVSRYQKVSRNTRYQYHENGIAIHRGYRQYRPALQRRVFMASNITNKQSIYNITGIISQHYFHIPG